MCKAKVFIARLALALCCLSGAGASAQVNKLYTVENGLSSSLITCAHQDQRGFLWIGTEYGLNRFDGSKFVLYMQSSDITSLTNNNISLLYETVPGVLLVGTDKGMSRYIYDVNGFETILFQYKGRMVLPRVTGVVEVGTEFLWIATADYGLFTMRPSESVARFEANITSVLGGKHLRGLTKDKNQNVWGIGNGHLLVSYNVLTRKTGTYAFDGEPVDVKADRVGRIFVALRNGRILKYDAEQDKVLPIPNMHGDSYTVHSLYVSPINVLLVATEGQGIRFLNSATGQIENYRNPNVGYDFSHSKVHAILRDRMNDLWLGVYQEGLFYSHSVNKSFIYYGKHSPAHNIIGFHAVLALSKDNEGNLWIGTDGDGLYRLNVASGSARHYKPGRDARAVSAVVSALYNDSDGTLWVGSHDKGLSYINRSTGACTPIPELAGEKVSFIGENGKKELLIGTRGAGVFLLSMETLRIVLHLQSLKLDLPDYTIDELPSDHINTLLADSKGLLWIGHDVGLSCYDGSRKTFLRYHSTNNLLPANTVNALCEDRQGYLWIGTSTRLYRMDKISTAFEKYAINSTGASAMICGIAEDNFGNLWISTYKGLCRLSVVSRDHTTYYANDGLQGNEFTVGAVCADAKDGQLFFGGTNGVTFFAPNNIAENPKLGTPVITALTLANKSTSVPGKGAVFHLAPNENSFTIEFSQMDYLNAAKAVYRYRMEGVSDEWKLTSAGSTQLTYEMLPTGKYTFTLCLANDYSSDNATSITIYIGRPHSRMLYVALCLAGLAAAAGAVVIGRKRRKK